MSQLALNLSAPAPDARRLLDLVAAPGAVHEALGYMAIAEEVLAGERLPPGGFAALRPSPILRGGGQHCYRAHVRELVARIRAGEDLAPATDAECLRAMVETALRAPLAPHAGCRRAALRVGDAGARGAGVPRADAGALGRAGGRGHRADAAPTRAAGEEARVKPLYDRDGVVLHLGDCREVLPRLQPGSVDAVIADPPYGDTSLEWDAPVREWLALVRPLLKPSASVWCFGSMRFFLAEAAEFAGWRYAQDIVWEKHNGTNSANDRFRRVHELAVQLYPAGARWEETYKLPQTTPDATKKVVRRKKRPAHWGEIGGHTYLSEDGGPRLMRSVLKVRSCHGHAVHPTQKPVGIVEPLIRYSCPPGGLVLDPFAGSGTTLVVAKALGMRAIGVELSPVYCERAIDRLVQTMPLPEVA